MQNLKREKNNLHLEAHKVQKEAEVDKIEIRQLKKNLEFVPKKRQDSTDSVKVLENNMKSTTNKGTELENTTIDLKLTH